MSGWKRTLAELASAFGAEVVDADGRGHLKIVHPSGWFVFVAKSPGDRRVLANIRSDLRRKAVGVWR